MNESPRLPIVVEDPPQLRAMLLAAGKDQEVQAEISRAYYGCLEGVKGSPFLMIAVLLSAIGNAIMVRLDAIAASLASPGGNGISPGQLKSTQQKTEQVSDLRRVVEDLQHATGTLNQKLNAAGVETDEAWTTKWAKRAGAFGIVAVIAIASFFAGRHMTDQEERQATAELIDAIKHLPSSPTGGILIDRLKLSNGTISGPKHP
jgi:hypothetical protein